MSFFEGLLPLNLIGRSTRIRTLDPLVPNQVRYQTAPHSAKQALYQAARDLLASQSRDEKIFRRNRWHAALIDECSMRVLDT